ncbi:MAG: hypothetical protein EBZ69_07715, partial [Alphaproteobacteria bacterium]|nr:hypothetical protein [Alphaproteobacteria bacterium]
MYFGEHQRILKSGNGFFVARNIAAGENNMIAWIKINERTKGREGLQSPIVKNLHDEALHALLDRTAAQDGDLLFFGADKAKVVFDAMGALRLKV